MDICTTPVTERSDALKEMTLNFYRLNRNESMIINRLDDLQIKVAFNSFHNCYDRFCQVVAINDTQLKVTKI
jgi:hypothetical protein